MPRSSRRGTRVNTERVAKMETLLYRLDSELNRTVSNSCGNPVIHIAQITLTFPDSVFFVNGAIHTKKEAKKGS